MPKQSVSFDETILQPLLRDDKEAVAYLSECLADDDQRVFLLGLKQYVVARNIPMTELAQKTGIQRAKLYRILSLQGNPEWRTIWAILNALGLHLSIQSNQSVRA